MKENRLRGLRLPRVSKLYLILQPSLFMVTGQLLTHQTDAEVGEARVQVEANLPVLENVNADYVA